MTARALAIAILLAACATRAIRPTQPDYGEQGPFIGSLKITTLVKVPQLRELLEDFRHYRHAESLPEGDLAAWSLWSAGALQQMWRQNDIWTRPVPRQWAAPTIVAALLLPLGYGAPVGGVTATPLSPGRIARERLTGKLSYPLFGDEGQRSVSRLFRHHEHRRLAALALALEEHLRRLMRLHVAGRVLTEGMVHDFITQFHQIQDAAHLTYERPEALFAFALAVSAAAARGTVPQDVAAFAPYFPTGFLPKRVAAPARYEAEDWDRSGRQVACILWSHLNHRPCPYAFTPVEILLQND